MAARKPRLARNTADACPCHGTRYSHSGDMHAAVQEREIDRGAGSRGGKLDTSNPREDQTQSDVAAFEDDEHYRAFFMRI